MAVGLIFSIWSTFYKIGVASNMGPGYFPLLISVVLMVLGLANIFKSITTNEQRVPINLASRPLFFILLANILFGLLLPVAGLVVSIFVLVVVASFAMHGTKLKEILIIGLVLSILSCSVFIWALSMPIPILPRFI